MFKNVVIIVVSMSILFSGVCFAGNPADVTGLHRWSPGEFYMATSEGDGSLWAFAQVPVREDVSLSLYEWRNSDGNERSMEVELYKRFSKNFDVAFNSESFSSSSTTVSNTLFVDLRHKCVGLGVLIPLESERSIKVGPRVTFGDFTFFASFAEDGGRRFGATWRKPGAPRVEVAISNRDQWWLRVCQGFQCGKGVIIPELRFQDGKAGFALAYAR